MRTLTTKLITDSEITIQCELVTMTEKMATVITYNNEIKKVKIKKSFDGKRYIMPNGNYSMAPIFYID